MRVHIWIRQENEDWWKEHGSSAWVNEQIERASVRAYGMTASPEEVKESFDLDNEPTYEPMEEN